MYCTCILDQRPPYYALGAHNVAQRGSFGRRVAVLELRREAETKGDESQGDGSL